jgi:hypothetical protein
MTNRLSVATIASPEFINIEGISPFASKCEIKVLYLGENRNHSLITKEVATEMAKTLPGVPIVGYFSESVEDFRDHGDQMIIDGDGVKFKSLTKPYGFVAPDTKIWFQDFEDTDEFGNTVVRTYLMTEGYLWTEQYEEAQRVINEGRPQSMELDTKTLKGHWSTDINRGIDFFIINDAIFSKLCILGDDVEPCFEGASVTAPDVSSNFTKDDNFAKTLYTMMEELKELTLSQNKGGQAMDENIQVVESADATEEVKVEEVLESTDEVVENEEKNLEEQDNVDLENIEENNNNIEEYKKNDEEDKDEAESKESDDETEEDDEEKKAKSKNTLEEQYALVQEELTELKEQFNLLEKENKELKEFKANIEDKEKDNLIDSFYMLSDEDKIDVIENKANYSLEDIENKLSVICVRKQVFSAKESIEGEKETEPTLYNLNECSVDNTPAWIKAVENRRKDNN